MKILIKTLSDGIGHQIIDAWHAYVQHINNYNNDIEECPSTCFLAS